MIWHRIISRFSHFGVVISFTTCKFFISAFCLLSVCNQGCKRQAEYIAFAHCNIIDGTGDSIKSDQTLVLKADLIYDIGPYPEIPQKCKVIDASGKTIIPGMIDMHGHLYAAGSSQFAAYPKLYLAGGVTTIFSPGEFEPDKAIQLREKINNDELTGPTILTAGSYFDTYPSGVPWIEACKDTFEVIGKFNRWKDKIDAIKVYSNISEEHFKVIKRLAEERGFFITGHLGSLKLKTAIENGINGFEHGLFAIPEIMSEKEPLNNLKKISDADLGSDSIRSLIMLIVRNNVYCDPTIVAYESLLPSFSIADDVENYLPGTYKGNRSSFFNDEKAILYVEESIKKQLAFCRLLYDNGGTLVTGTDPVNPVVLPGYGIKREMELLVKAGIPPVEVIKIATLNGATALRMADRIGSIKPGKAADLVLLNGNPLEDFANIRKVEIVVKGGRIYNPGSLRKSVLHSITVRYR